MTDQCFFILFLFPVLLFRYVQTKLASCQVLIARLIFLILFHFILDFITLNLTLCGVVRQR